MNQLRIVMVGMSRLLLDIVRDIVAAEEDLEMVAEASSWDELQREGDIDVALLSADLSDLADLQQRIFAKFPSARIVVLQPSRVEQDAYTLKLQRRNLPDLSSASLLEAIRGKLPEVGDG